MNIMQETFLPYESCTICYIGGYFHLVLTFPWTLNPLSLLEQIVTMLHQVPGSGP